MNATRGLDFKLGGGVYSGQMAIATEVPVTIHCFSVLFRRIALNTAGNRLFSTS
jgi:hypothetical protein